MKMPPVARVGADGDSTVTGAAASAPQHLPRIVVGDDGRRMRLVDEETLRYFLSRPLRPPLTRNYSPQLMRRVGLDEQQVDTLLRAFENARKTHDAHVDVLRQYRAKGYAYLEIPELYPDDDGMGMDEQTVELN